MTQSPHGDDPSAHPPVQAPTPPTFIVAAPPGPPTSGMAVASLVLGIVGVLGGWCTFAIPCILAIVFGYVGLGHTRGGARKGRGMAIAGLVLGLIPTAVIALILVFGGIGALLMPVSSVSQRMAEKTPAADAPQGNGVVVPMDDAVTINLADGHYLKLKMALQQSAGQTGEVDVSTALNLAVENYTGRTVGELSTENGRAAAKQELLDKVTTAYGGAVTDVYFTQFVTQ